MNEHNWADFHGIHAHSTMFCTDFLHSILPKFDATFQSLIGSTRQHSQGQRDEIVTCSIHCLLRKERLMISILWVITSIIHHVDTRIANSGIPLLEIRRGFSNRVTFIGMHSIVLQSPLILVKDLHCQFAKYLKQEIKHTLPWAV